MTVEREWFEEEWVSAVDKLNKVVEAADRMLDAFCVHETQQQVEAYDSMCATLAEIKGDSHD